MKGREMGKDKDKKEEKTVKNVNVRNWKGQKEK